MCLYEQNFDNNLLFVNRKLLFFIIVNKAVVISELCAVSTEANQLFITKEINLGCVFSHFSVQKCNELIFNGIKMLIKHRSNGGKNFQPRATVPIITFSSI